MAVSPHSPGTVLNAAVVELPDFAKQHANLASADFGAKVLDCSDQFFAEADRMLQSSAPIFVVGKFDDHGKWMDGWETRRKRHGGYDFAVIRLGMPGMIKGVDIDTSHFTGNFPPAASIHACHCSDDPDEHTTWVEIVPATSLKGNSHHFIPLSGATAWTHLRLNIFPDGGVARLRVYGQPVCDWASKDPNALHEVSLLENGGRVVGFNDAHFGTPFRLIMPGRGVNMGDGWETRRRREPGHDWCIIALGHAATIEKIEVDTAHFKGNFPDRVSLQAAHAPALTDEAIITQAMFWPLLLAEQQTRMDEQHLYEGKHVLPLGPVTHVKLNMIPDGGVSRLRIWGRLAW
jgi:allantoicase